MSPTIAFLSVLLISVQGFEQDLLLNGLSQDSLSLKEEHEGLVSEVKDWLVSTVKDIKNDVDGQMQHLNTVLETSAKEGEQRIHQMYEQTKQKLKTINAPEDCLNGGENHLMLKREVTANNFLKCSNMSQAVKDVVSIAFTAGQLLADSLLTADDILNGFTQCWSWRPWVFLRCTWTYLKNAVGDTFHMFSELRQFTSNITSLVSDINAQIQYCTHEGQDSLLDHMTESLSYIHDCSLKTNSK